MNIIILFSKLYSIGINGTYFNLLLALYKNVKACVKSLKGLSPTFKCTRGVRQVCNSLFVNDIENYLCNSGFGQNITRLLYADDLVIMSEG